MLLLHTTTNLPQYFIGSAAALSFKLSRGLGGMGSCQLEDIVLSINFKNVFERKETKKKLETLIDVYEEKFLYFNNI